MTNALGTPYDYRWELAALALAALPFTAGPFLFLPLLNAMAPEGVVLGLSLLSLAVLALLLPRVLHRRRPFLTALWLIAGAMVATDAVEALAIQLATSVFSIGDASLHEFQLALLLAVTSIRYATVAFIASRPGLLLRDRLFIAAGFLVFDHVTTLVPARVLLPYTNGTVLTVLWAAFAFRILVLLMLAVAFNVYEWVPSHWQRFSVWALIVLPLPFTIGLGIGFDFMRFSVGGGVIGFLEWGPVWARLLLDYLLWGGLLLGAVWVMSDDSGRSREPARAKHA